MASPSASATTPKAARMALSATSRTCACYASGSTPLASAHRRRQRRMALPALRTDPWKCRSRYRRLQLPLPLQPREARLPDRYGCSTCFQARPDG